MNPLVQIVGTLSALAAPGYTVAVCHNLGCDPATCLIAAALVFAGVVAFTVWLAGVIE